MNVPWPYLAAASLGFASVPASAQPAPSSTQPGDSIAPSEPGPPSGTPTTPDGPDPTPPEARPGPEQPDAPPGSAPLADSPLVGPKIDVSVPEPALAVVRTAKNHDGFYLRSSIGLSTSTAFVATDSATHPNYTLGGGGLTFDLLVGGTPSPGLALGGGVMLRSVTDAEVDVDGPGRAGSGTGGLLLAGVFVDGFPKTNGGLHLGGLFGLAGGSARRQDDTDEFDGGGLGMAVWVGHGFWVGSEWSIGGLLKLDAALLRDDSGPVVLANTTYGLSLLFSVLHH